MGAARGGASRRRRPPGGPRQAAPSCARVEAELTGGVIELQAAREDAERAGEDDAPVLCPFKGLASFDVADAPYFFGRERLVAELVARLVGAPLLGIVGPSGSGKSSVVRAGLLPALAGGVLPGSADWAQVVMRPGRASAARARGRHGGTSTATVACCSRSTSSRRRSRCAATRRSARAFVAELAGRPGRADRGAGDPRRLLRALRRLPGARARCSPRITCWSARCAATSCAGRWSAPRSGSACGSSPSSPMRWWATSSTSRARCRCSRPRCSSCGSGATGAGCAWPPTRPPGGVRGAVARHAEEAFARLDRGQQAARARRAAAAGRPRAPAARSSAGGSRSPSSTTTRRRGRRHAHRPAPADGQRRARSSSRTRRCCANGRGCAAGWRRTPTAGACTAASPTPRASGTTRGRDPGDLYRGARLAGALEWRAAPRARPQPHRARLPGRQPRRRAARARTPDSRRRRAVALGVAVLAVITGISTIARRPRHPARALRAARRRLTRPRHARAGAPARQPSPWPGCSRWRPTAASRPSRPAAPCCPCCPSLAAYRRLGRPLEHGAALESVAISPDGRTLAAAADDGTISLWDVATRRRLGRPLAGHDGAVHDVAFSPDGKRLASGGDDGTVRLWDVADASTDRPSAPPARRSAINGVAFSPDGTTLASAAAAHGPPRHGPARRGAASGTSPPAARSARRWRPARRSRRARVQPGRQAPRHRRQRQHRAALGPRRPAASSARRSPAHRSGTTPSRSVPTAGRWRAAATDAHGAALGRARPPAARRAARGPRGTVNSVAFSPDGTHAGQRRRRRHGAALERRHASPPRRAGDRHRPPAARAGRPASPASSGVAFSPRGGILASAASRRGPALEHARRPSAQPAAPRPPRLGSRRRLHAGRHARLRRHRRQLRLWDARRARALGRPPSDAPRLWDGSQPGRAHARRRRSQRPAADLGCARSPPAQSVARPATKAT